MINLRALSEADLAHTLEGEFASLVTLIGPNGAKQTVRGRVRLTKPRTNLDTGEVAFDFDPNVTLRRSSLSPVPAAGEKWGVLIPDSPLEGAPTTLYMLDTTRAPEGGRTLGTIKYYVQTAEASS